MKRFCLFLIVLCIITISCSKKDNKSPFTYVVNGITDVTINAGDNITLPLQVGLLSGTQETVTLGFSGLPSGVTITPSSSSGVPTFTSNFTIAASDSAALGTHSITVTSSSTSTTAKTYTMNVTVASCVPGLTGTYSATEACSTSSDDYTVVATAIGTTQLKLTNFNNFVNIVADIVCSSNTVIIHSQTVDGFTYSGAGTISGNTMTITYSVSNSSATEACTVTLTKM